MSVNAYFKKPIPIAADGTIQYEKPSEKYPEAGTTQTTPVKPENYPSAWVDPYKDNWMGYLNQYENRGPFEFSANDDALYQQLRDQYIQQGHLAMEDTMGKAAAMTGGYGNSYAQSVGQQAFNQYLTQLNSVMPELYDMAYDRYEKEGQDILNKYSLYKGLSEQDYENWYKEVGSVPEYEPIPYEEQKKWLSDMRKAESIEAIKDIGDRMQAAGIDPEFIANEVAKAIAAFGQLNT